MTAANQHRVFATCKPNRRSVAHTSVEYDYPLDSFISGRRDEPGKPGFDAWPGVGEQIVDGIRSLISRQKPLAKSTASYVGEINVLFRIRTSIKRACLAAAIGDVTSVSCVLALPGDAWAAITDGILASNRKFAAKTYTTCLRVLDEAARLENVKRQQRGIKAIPFFLPPNCIQRPTSSAIRAYSDGVKQQIVRAGTTQFEQVLSRIDRGFQQADAGSDPRLLLTGDDPGALNQESLKRIFTEDNTLNLVAAAIQVALPRPALMQEMIGTMITVLHPSRPRLLRDAMILHSIFEDARRILLPRKEDLVGAFVAATTRLGFNSKVTLDMDVRKWRLKHPTAANTLEIKSKKERARCAIQTSYSDNSPHGASAIIEAVINMTEPLRRDVRREMLSIEGTLTKEINPSTRHALNRDHQKLDDLSNRIWLFVAQNPLRVQMLKQDSDFFAIANELLKRHDVKDEDGVPQTWSGNRARRGLAEFLYNRHNGDPAPAQMALGHDDPRTTEGYLNAGALRDQRTVQTFHALESALSRIESGPLDQSTQMAGESESSTNLALVTRDALPFLISCVDALELARQATPIERWETSGLPKYLAAFRAAISLFPGPVADAARRDATIERLKDELLRVLRGML